MKQIKKQKIAFVLGLLIVSTFCMTACGNPSNENSQEVLQMQQSNSETTPRNCHAAAGGCQHGDRCDCRTNFKWK